MLNVTELIATCETICNCGGSTAQYYSGLNMWNIILGYIVLPLIAVIIGLIIISQLKMKGGRK